MAALDDEWLERFAQARGVDGDLSPWYPAPVPESGQPFDRSLALATLTWDRHIMGGLSHRVRTGAVDTRIAELGGVADWTPADLGADIKGWWTALTPADGTVSTWTAIAGPDLTGEGDPTKSLTGFDGQRAGVAFDGDDSCVTTDLSALPTGAATGEIWAVYNCPAATALTQIILRYGGSTAGTHRSFSIFPSGTITGGDASASSNSASGGGIGRHVVGAVFDAAVQLRIDGVARPASANATWNTATTRLRIGAAVGASANTFFTGAVQRVLVTALLSDANRLKLEGWLHWDAGLETKLPLTHPYRFERPS